MEGRYLLGIEPTATVAAFIARHTDGEIDTGVLEELNESARARRRATTAGVIQPPVTPIPEAHSAHLETVQNRLLFKRLFDGTDFAFKLVDIASLISVQPHVNVSYATDRVPADPSFAQVLDIALPAQGEPVSIWGGIAMNAEPSCTICTRDLNLRVAEATMDHSEGLRVTFALGRSAVFAVVLQLGDRLILKDGTHRALGLLARGVRRMPCVILKDAREADLPDILPPEVLLGPTPPRIGDFLDPELHLEHPWPNQVKFIRITVDEFVAPHEGANG